MSKAKKEGAPAEQSSWRAVVGGLWWCVFSGTLTFLAFPFRAVPDSAIWPLGWLCLVPLLWALRGAPPRRAFWFGACMGLVTNFGGFWWIHGVLRDFGHLPEVVAWPLTALNAAYQGLQLGLFAWLLSRLTGNGKEPAGIWRTAAVFTAVEAIYPLIFPWHLGNSQHPFLEAIQVADILGVAGVTFTVVLANALVLHGLLRLRGQAPPGARPRAALVWIAAVFVYGAIRIVMVDGQVEAAEKREFGLVEANIGIFEKEAKGLAPRERALTLHRNLLSHQRMSMDLVAQGVDLIVWPESSYIPLGQVYGKRLDAFGLGVGPRGRTALWRDLGAAGFQWTVGPTGTEGAGQDWTAVDAAREDAVILVGERGLVRFWNGRDLAAVPLEIGGDVRSPRLTDGAVTAAKGSRPPADGDAVLLWAVGDHGTVLRGTPERMHLLPSGTDVGLTGIAMAGSRHGIAVGQGGVIVAVDAEGGHLLESKTASDLHDVWRAPGEVAYWAVGADGTVIHGDGRRWVAEDAGTTVTLRALAGVSTEALWAVGDDGTVVRRTADGAWVPEQLGSTEHLVAAMVGPRGEVMVAGAEGGLWSRRDVAEGAEAAWDPLEAPGIGPLLSMTRLPWVEMTPIPRDTRYLYQGRSEPTDVAVFDGDPDAELALPLRDRTAVQRGFRSPILFGALTWETVAAEGGPGRRIFNTAVMLDEMGRVVGMYDKVYLLVFGEYIPFGDSLPFLYDWVPAASHFTPGTDVKVFDWDGVKIGALVCYEDILPRFAADVMARRPDVLVNVTNDAWFGKTGEPYLHLALAVMRSVEHRRTLIRSTNTGVSAIIDPVGRLSLQTDLDEPEVLRAAVPMMKETTIYGRIGDLFAYLLLAWVGWLALRARVGWRKGA